MATFTTTLIQSGNNVGIEVPAEVVESFGAGKRVPVVVTLNGYSYRNTIASMGGKFMVGIAKEHREPARISGGETLEVTIEHDTAPREVEVPAALAEALAEAGLRERFDALAFTYRKEHARTVVEAKAEATRDRRIAKIVESLR